jgi:hypothetical protein
MKKLLIIPQCTLKPINQKENVLTLIRHFKEKFTGILFPLDQKKPDYDLLNIDELNDVLKKRYNCYWKRLFNNMKKLT